MSRNVESETDLTDTERAALHDLQLGIEHVHRAYGALLEFHHETGHAMDKFDQARERLRAAGHDEFADALRDDLLPTGVVGDRWSYDVVETVRREFVRELVDFERTVRADIADGREHVTERDQQRRWRERAGRENARTER